MFCFHCNKKSFVMIQCKCEKSFCVKHQLPEKHSCAYVFEKYQVEKIPVTKKIEVI